MRYAARPVLRGVTPYVELSLSDRDGTTFMLLDLELAARLVADLRVTMQQGMALHELICDRSTAPLMMLASEGAA